MPPALLSEGRRDTGADADVDAPPPTSAPSEADPPSPPERALVIMEAEEEGEYCSLFGTEGLLSRREEEEDVEGYWCCCVRNGEALDKEAWIEADLGDGGGCGGLARRPPPARCSSSAGPAKDDDPLEMVRSRRGSCSCAWSCSPAAAAVRSPVVLANNAAAASCEPFPPLKENGLTGERVGRNRRSWSGAAESARRGMLALPLIRGLGCTRRRRGGFVPGGGGVCGGRGGEGRAPVSSLARTDSCESELVAAVFLDAVELLPTTAATEEDPDAGSPPPAERLPRSSELAFRSSEGGTGSVWRSRDVEPGGGGVADLPRSEDGE